jgi:hypothetical protein
MVVDLWFNAVRVQHQQRRSRSAYFVMAEDIGYSRMWGWNLGKLCIFRAE